MTTCTELSATLDALVEPAECSMMSFSREEDFVPMEDQQARQCQSFCEHLELGQYKSVRQILGNASGKLTPVLVELMNHRVDTDDLLPGTQDAEANNEVLRGTSNAMTLTAVSTSAASLYARLLSFPGALGSGLVQLEALMALLAFMRRWTVECCGREKDLSGEQSFRSSPMKSPPKKRSKSSSLEIEPEADGLDSSPQAILQGGLLVAKQVSYILDQREFESWSSEAREVILEAVVVMLGNSAALNQSHLAERAGEALKLCIGRATTTRLETTVVTLREISHILQFKEVLPNGEKGKMSAHKATRQTLCGLIEGLATTQQATSLRDSTNLVLSTPSRRQSRSAMKETPSSVSLKRSNDRRSSAGGPSGMMSPALKGKSPAVDQQVFETPISSPSGTDPKPRQLFVPFIGLLQNLSSSRGLEKASAREPTIATVNACTMLLPPVERAHFLKFLVKLASSSITTHRLISTELIGSVLNEEWISMHTEDSMVASPGAAVRGESPPSFSGEMPLPVALWQALQGRLVDKMATVRARAASSIESAITHNQGRLDESLLGALRNRVGRDKHATVRKACLMALSKLLLTHPDLMLRSHLQILGAACSDASQMTRKAAADGISNLVKSCPHSHELYSFLEQRWTAFVLPMVLDDEVGNKVVKLVDEILFRPILQGEGSAATSWRILSHVAQAGSQSGTANGAGHALNNALKKLRLENKQRIDSTLLRTVVVVAVDTLDEEPGVDTQDEETGDVNTLGVWCLLEAIFSQIDSNAVEKVIHHLPDVNQVLVHAWQTLSTKQTMRYSLLVLRSLASGLDTDVATECHSSLLKVISDLSLSPQMITTSVSTLVALSTRTDPEHPRQSASTWIRAIYDRSEQDLTSILRGAAEKSSETDYFLSSEEIQRLVRTVFTIGEVSMIGFSTDDDNNSSQSALVDSSDELKGLHVKPKKSLQDLIKTMLPTELPGLGRVRTPDCVRAHSFTALGKLCLRDENLAQQSLNILARELNSATDSSCAAVQSNALLVLGDLCVRYTNMADRYLPVMASCLQAGVSNQDTPWTSTQQSDSTIIRKHAVLLLSSLLVQDYIKWRGLLFHRFLVACSDENLTVSRLAVKVLCGPLLNRSPRLFFNHFVESLFVLNRCTAHPIYVAAASHGDGGSGIVVSFEGINLDGEYGRARRRAIYCFMISKLSDEDKIGVAARLAKEVLGSAVNGGDLGRVCDAPSGELPKNNSSLRSAENVLSDVLFILSHKSMLVGKKKEAIEDVDDPNVPNPSRRVKVAKKRLLSKISRKHMIEILLPILCNLKTKLTASCSPLLKDLMNYLLVLFRSYKVEVKEFMATDPTLLQELEYDARHCILDKGQEK